MIIRIKELREEFGLTQKELAAKIGNVQRNISNWENGSSEPDCETLVRLADVFGVTMDELFGRNEEPERGALQSEPYYKLIKRLNDRQSDALKSFLSAFCE